MKIQSFIPAFLLLISCSFLSVTVVQAESFDSGDVSNSVSDLLNEDKIKNDVIQLIESNKKLLKRIKSINGKEKAQLIKAVNKVEKSIKTGTSSETIQNTLDDALGKIN